MASIMLVVEDRNSTATYLDLVISPKDFKQYFADSTLNLHNLPEGTTIGIKQPFLKLSFGGGLSLRCDNASNLIIRLKLNDPQKQVISQSMKCKN